VGYKGVFSRHNRWEVFNDEWGMMNDEWGMMNEE
jgi:hypothetical protein